MWGQKTEGSLLCYRLFWEHRLGTESKGSRRLGSLEAGCQHGCHDGHGLPLSQPSLTWPLMSGFAPMAVCSSFTSLVGPVMSEVPVSTMASQPPLQRVSPLATSTLGKRCPDRRQLLEASRQRLQGAAGKELTAACIPCLLNTVTNGHMSKLKVMH